MGQITSGLKKNTGSLEKATEMFHTSLFIETFPLAEFQASCSRMINLHMNGIVTDKGSRHAGN
ncbi:MAG: hypothetical protein U9P36_01750 [Thermodesulfobacteriota bacterium]|nr:hypothetical protein [Thermodesulfobacteriota bacterium]